MTRAGTSPETGPDVPVDLESTARLLARVRNGDAAAKDRLAGRYLEILKHWARGRLPVWARDLSDTDDIVQVTLVRALNKVSEFEPRHEGAFLAYLRRILLNEIRDQIRRKQRTPDAVELDEKTAVDAPTALDLAIGEEAMEAYEEALKRLPERQRQAVMLRIEMGFSHQEVADAVGCPSANAARMLVSRGLVRLAEVMNGE